MITNAFTKVSEVRKEQIIEEITSGSEPGFRFYALLATASLIAAFGLISNSTAVIIGAMLVSPLMTPIIGITLGIVIGKPSLLTTSLRSVVLGVVLAIIFAGLIGFLPLELTATQEMLSRTKPTLLDLMVAVLAGFAGAYAMIDEKLSPALPGVAIATAIVPPLSNTGICLSLGYYYGAFGSFMLFFANFLSILLVAGTTFMLAGLSPWWISVSSKDLIKRFGLAIVGFLAVCVFLTYSLVEIVQERYLSNTIKNVLDSAMNELHTTSLDSFIYDVEDGKLYVLANIKSPRTVTPFQVEAVQEKIKEQTNRPTELIIRNVLAQDVGTIGSGETVIRQNLDGFFLKETLSDWKKAVNIIERELLEKFTHWHGMSLVDVDYVELPRGPTVVATIKSYRNLTESEISELQQILRNKMNNQDMGLIIKNEEITFSDASGNLLPGYIYAGFTDEQERLRGELEKSVRKKFEGYDDITPINIHHKPMDGSWHILVETVGTGAFTADDLTQLENTLRAQSGIKVDLAVWKRADILMTSEGFTTFKKFNQTNTEDIDRYLRDREMSK